MIEAGGMPKDQIAEDQQNQVEGKDPGGTVVGVV